MLSLCYRVGKLLSDSVGFLIVYFSRLKGLYQMVGEIVPFLYGLCKRKSLVHIFCHKSRSPVKYLKNGITVIPCPLCSL